MNELTNVDNKTERNGEQGGKEKEDNDAHHEEIIEQIEKIRTTTWAKISTSSAQVERKGTLTSISKAYASKDDYYSGKNFKNFNRKLMLFVE